MKERLPDLEVLARIAARLDRDAAYKLVREYGGTMIYVPRKPTKTHKLAVRLGLKLVVVLVELFGHGSLWVPLAGTGSAAARRRAMVETKGTAAEVSRALGVHQVTVHRNRGKARRETGGLQIDLFSKS